MRRSDSSTPFDHEIEPESDLTREFWGAAARWRSGDDRHARLGRRIDDTGSLRALRDGVAAFRPQRVDRRDPTGEVRRTRSHGVVRSVEPPVAERRAAATIGDLAAGHYDDLPERPDHDLPLTPVEPIGRQVGLGAVDPLLVRLGALVLVGALLVPPALAMRPSDDLPDTVRIESPVDEIVQETVAAEGGTPSAAPASHPADQNPSPGPVADQTPTPAPPQSADTDGAVVAPTVDAPPAESAGSAAAQTPAASTEQPVGDVVQSVDAGIVKAATAAAPAERIIPDCPQIYEAVPGDSWYGIAAAAGVSPSALMAENRATVDTVIFAGDDICLPAGATVPTATTPTTPPSTTPASTVAPTTTAPPTTTPAGSPGRNASVDEVKAVIRSVFPESEWDTAFLIVQRESRFDPTAYNGWCCYGLFQIYWSVHRGWLDDLGIDSADDLFDPLLNTRAAYAIWQRSGNSWSAWSTYG